MSYANLNFLIVEDHDFQRRALARMLERLGAKTIYEAVDGHSALAILHDPARPVDIVITDLDMPGMDGMEFIRHVGASEIQVSLILGSSLESKLLASIETMTEAYGIKLLGVLEKPLTPGNLGPLVRLHQPAHAKPDRLKTTALTFTVEEVAAGLRNDQFEPFFQPKVELGTANVKGAEALARWRHPEHGIVPPHAFIKTLEDNGLIDELTWVMLAKSSAFCRAWRAAGVDATVSVNLSVKSLDDLKIANSVTELVRSHNVDPRHMILEITETAATTELGTALENLARLRMKGFGLSIDDYGTGYSSMKQLTRIAFTEIKIDQSFVTNAAKHESARVILVSSLDMAKNLSITAVAEGVETQADWNLLYELGYDLAQGYLIARPMESEVFLDWARDWDTGSRRAGRQAPGQG